jgi:hypothetical protein
MGDKVQGGGKEMRMVLIRDIALDTSVGSHVLFPMSHIEVCVHTVSHRLLGLAVLPPHPKQQSFHILPKAKVNRSVRVSRGEKIVFSFAPRPGRAAVTHCEDVQIQPPARTSAREMETPSQRTDCAMFHPKAMVLRENGRDAQYCAPMKIRDLHRAQYHYEAETIRLWA